MAIEYKNVVTSVTTTGSDQTIYTCPTSTNLVKYSAIVKTFTVLNNNKIRNTAIVLIVMIIIIIFMISR